jgi:hypothetical protein
MRPYLRTAVSAAAIGLIVGTQVHAQDTTTSRLQTQQDSSSRPQSHTVVKGDNLWTLAQTYLGNPFLWPELYRLNRDVVEDPHWIYPGEIIRLRSAEVTIVAVNVPPDSLSMAPGNPVIPNPALPTIPGDTSKAQQPVVTPPVVVAPPVSNEPPAPDELPTNLFSRVEAAGNASTGAAISRMADAPMAANPTVRPGEALVAPFVEREGGPRSYGRLLKSGDLPGIAQVTDRELFQAFDKVMIEPPVGNVAPEGEKFLAYRLGPILHNLGQVMIPTGIVEVVQAPRAGAPAIAKVVRAFNELSASDRLMPLDTAGIGSTIRARRVVDGPSTTIRWIYGEPVLASVQAYVVLDLSSKNGVKVGDEFQVYQPRPSSKQSIINDPPVPVGKLRVVRSTPYGVTAIVVGQEQPSISEGMPARVIARIP